MPKGYSKAIHAVVLSLSFFGAIMATSASMNRITWNALFLNFVKEIFFIAAGYIAMVFLARYLTFSKMKKYIFPIALIMAGVLLLPVLYGYRGGARAWIVLPFVNMTVQPSEFAKIVVILLFATYLGDVQSTKATWWEIIRVPASFLLLYTFIILIIQSDLGTAVIIFAIGWFSVLLTQVKQLSMLRKFIAISSIVAMIAVIWLLTPNGLAFLNSLPLPRYIIARFNDMANPFINRYGSSFQLFNSLIAIVKGNWTGLGLGKSVQKLGYLPVADSDYILAIIIEEIGILGFVFILLGYIILIGSLFYHALALNDEKGKMVLFGTAMFLMLHFILNIGGVTALIPLTGVPLLMISSGGSSQVAIMMALGISQGILARNRERWLKEHPHANNRG